ncbi:hypothetical protein D770_01285 [Flammeovirgaceae bacterium 311]|nr:hypothetical protein D770_01285 [Flammeovirgaceae bacterium 311]
MEPELLLLPVHFPHTANWINRNQLVLAADVGGSKTIPELFEVKDDTAVSTFFITPVYILFQKAVVHGLRPGATVFL